MLNPPPTTQNKCRCSIFLEALCYVNNMDLFHISVSRTKNKLLLESIFPAADVPEVVLLLAKFFHSAKDF